MRFFIAFLLLAPVALAIQISVSDQVLIKPIETQDIISLAQGGANVIGSVSDGDGNIISVAEFLRLQKQFTKPSGSSSSGFCNPVGVKPTSPFGACRTTSESSCGRLHKGIDIPGASGTPIKAVASGTAYYYNSDPNGYGTAVLIKHDDGKSTTLYAHLKSISVQNGARVSQGQVIGRIGNSGNARNTGTHLHFEIRVNGKQVDPYPLISGNC